MLCHITTLSCRRSKLRNAAAAEAEGAAAAAGRAGRRARQIRMSLRSMKSVHEPVVVGLAGMVQKQPNWNGSCRNVHKYTKNNRICSHMQNICKTYARNMQVICRYMLKLCRYMPIICKKYARNMQIHRQY